jgi:hypothetical protein
LLFVLYNNKTYSNLLFDVPFTYLVRKTQQNFWKKTQKNGFGAGAMSRRVKGRVMSACSLLIFISYDVPWCGSQSLVSDACSLKILTAAMPDKRMRPIVKQETGSDCAR